jgi:hypothetical protein
MIAQKLKASQINAVKSRLEQIKTSNLFNQEEKDKLIIQLEKQLETLKASE